MPSTVATPSSTGTVIPTTTSEFSDVLVLVIDLLDGLLVVAEEREGYDRDLFTHWTDADDDGCDTRREVLIRDSQADHVMELDRECWIVSGLWYSVYDDVWVAGAPSELDIDHLVPLAEAWDSGAYGWDAELREAFANDEDALLAVTTRSNRSKGAADPAEWMPDNLDYTCTYVTGWVVTKARWDLTVDRREADFLRGLLVGECAGRSVDIDKPVLAVPDLDIPDLDVPALEVPGGPSEQPTSTTGLSNTAAPPNPGDSKNCGDFATQAEAQKWFAIYSPHYGDVAKLDRDGDGEVCESLP